MTLSVGGKVRSYIQGKRNSFLWGGFNDFYNSVYLPMSFGFCVNISSLLDVSSNSLIINNVFAVIYGISIVTSPLIIAYKLFKGWKMPDQANQRN